MRISVGLVVVGLGLSGCAPTPPTGAFAKNDPFKPYREIETEVFRVGTTPGVMQLRLVAEVDRVTAKTVILLKVHHSYGAAHRFNYEQARNAKAEMLPFVSVARYGACRQRTDCPMDELYKIEIPEADLRVAGAGGYALKVFPRVGQDVLITVPPAMIASVFTLLEADRRGVQPAKKACVHSIAFRSENA